MTEVAVTQEDRRAYLSLNMVCPQDKAAVLSGDWDAVHGMQVLALHRQHARSLALEEAALIAERDTDWSRFGKKDVGQWEGGPDGARDYRIGIASGRAIAAAVRSAIEEEGARDA